MIVREREGVLPGSINGVEGDLAGAEARSREVVEVVEKRCSLVSCLHVILNAAVSTYCQQELECFGILTLYTRFEWQFYSMATLRQYLSSDLNIGNKFLYSVAESLIETWP